MSYQDRLQRYKEIDEERAKGIGKHTKLYNKQLLQEEMWRIYGKKHLTIFDKMRLKKIHKKLYDMSFE